MVETKPARFEVVGRHNNHVWLEVLNGGDEGIRVSVPVRHPEYDHELEKRIDSLEVGDVQTFVLKSTRNNLPDWRIVEIRPERPAPPA